MIVAIMDSLPGTQTAERGILWTASCDWNGRHFTAQSRSGASFELCRHLVAAGCPEQEMELRLPNGFLMGKLKSISRGAARTIIEGSGTIREATYHPFPDASPARGERPKQG